MWNAFFWGSKQSQRKKKKKKERRMRSVWMDYIYLVWFFLFKGGGKKKNKIKIKRRPPFEDLVKRTSGGRPVVVFLFVACVGNNIVHDRVWLAPWMLRHKVNHAMQQKVLSSQNLIAVIIALALPVIPCMPCGQGVCLVWETVCVWVMKVRGASVRG